MGEGGDLMSNNIDEKTETGVPEVNATEKISGENIITQVIESPVNEIKNIDDKDVLVVGSDAKMIPDELLAAIKTTDGVVIDDGKIKDIETLTQEAVQDGKKQIAKKKKEIVLPEIGTKFLLTGESYKVCYVNKGQKRFSAEPCDGHY